MIKVIKKVIRLFLFPKKMQRLNLKQVFYNYSKLFDKKDKNLNKIQINQYNKLKLHHHLDHFL